MTLPGLSDYTEEQQEQIGLQMMAESFRVLENVGRELDGWTSMDATCRIAEDNAASSLHRRMSDELHYLMSSALDHLNLVHKLWAGGEMPPFAPFTLIRSAIESSAYGVWLQEAGTVDARLIRLLELQWDRRRNVDTYTAATES